jgi:hypothetical protein
MQRDAIQTNIKPNNAPRNDIAVNLLGTCRAIDLETWKTPAFVESLHHLRSTCPGKSWDETTRAAPMAAGVASRLGHNAAATRPRGRQAARLSAPHPDFQTTRAA